MRPLARPALLLLGLVACRRDAEALIFVSVSAEPALVGVAQLEVQVSELQGLGRSSAVRVPDVPLLPPVALDSAHPMTFGLYFPPGTGPLSLRAIARGPRGEVLADASMTEATLVPRAGQRRDVALVLRPSTQVVPPDGGSDAPPEPVDAGVPGDASDLAGTMDIAADRAGEDLPDDSRSGCHAPPTTIAQYDLVDDLLVDGDRGLIIPSAGYKVRVRVPALPNGMEATVGGSITRPDGTMLGALSGTRTTNRGLEYRLGLAAGAYVLTIRLVASGDGGNAGTKQLIHQLEVCGDQDVTIDLAALTGTQPDAGAGPPPAVSGRSLTVTGLEIPGLRDPATKPYLVGMGDYAFAGAEGVCLPAENTCKFDFVAPDGPLTPTLRLSTAVPAPSFGALAVTLPVLSEHAQVVAFPPLTRIRGRLTAGSEPHVVWNLTCVSEGQAGLGELSNFTAPGGEYVLWVPRAPHCRMSTNITVTFARVGGSGQSFGSLRLAESSVPTEVDGELDLASPSLTGAWLRGHLEGESLAQRILISFSSTSLTNLPGDTFSTGVQPDKNGDFVVAVPPGRYRLTFRSPMSVATPL
jgi:hypothetical protein